MARKKIPLRDKEIIKRRLAQGKSQREAIKETVVESHVTAGNIAKREMTDINQMRKKYLKLIEGFDAGDVDRAKLWAEMTRANKVISAQVINKKGDGMKPAHSMTKDFIDVPDWNNREKALKYIDQLAGLHEEEEKGGDQFNQFNFYNIPPEELKKRQREVLKSISNG